MPDSQPTTIHSLPPEVLHLILSFVSEEAQWALPSCALVSRPWSKPSQSLLWSEVHFGSIDSARRFVASSATQSGAFPVRRLSLAGDLYIGVDNQTGGVDNQTARAVVRCCKGVQSVFLILFRAMDPELLQEEALKDVTTLDMTTNVSHLLHAPLVLPFRLTTLTITTAALSRPILPALFGSSSRTLRSLEIVVFGDSEGPLDDAAFLSSFPLVAASLTDLHLPPNMRPSFLQLLRGCTTLHTLISEDYLQSMVTETLLALPPTATLRYLRVNRSLWTERGLIMDVDVAEGLERCLSFPCMVAIERIQVLGRPGSMALEKGRGWVVGKGIVQACSRRGIVMVYE